MDVMGKSEECENDGFFDDNHLYSTVAPDVDKMLRFQLPGPPDFSKANAVSQNFFASENAGTGLGCALLVGQSQFQLTNIASKMQPKEVTLQIEIAELAQKMKNEIFVNKVLDHLEKVKNKRPDIAHLITNGLELLFDQSSASIE